MEDRVGVELCAGRLVLKRVTREAVTRSFICRIASNRFDEITV